MIELVVCVLACASLVIAFKIFQRFQISSMVAIVVNYLVAASINFIYEPSSITIPNRMHEPWFLNGCILGTVFIVNFFIMGLSAQKMGASVTTVASKMSLVLTVIFSIIYFQENTHLLKISGIVLAIISVFLIVQINSKELDRRFIFLPLMLFIAGGFIDSFLKYNQHHHLITDNMELLFAGVTFSTAFVGGIPILISRVMSGKEQINSRSIIGGIILGVVNWISIYTLIITLKNPRWDSSTIYTYINVGILIVVVSLSVIIFKEKLRTIQWIGVGLAIVSILAISLV